MVSPVPLPFVNFIVHLLTSFSDELRGYHTKSFLSSFYLNSVIEFFENLSTFYFLLRLKKNSISVSWMETHHLLQFSSWNIILLSFLWLHLTVHGNPM